MIPRSLLIFLLKPNQSFLHLKNYICPVLLKEYQEINATAMDSYLFWFSFCVCFWARGPGQSLERRKLPCPGSTTQGTDAQVFKPAEGRFLRIFAATQILSGSQDPPARTHQAVGDLLLKLLDVTFLTALLPPSPAWPHCCCRSQFHAGQVRQMLLGLIHHW